MRISRFFCNRELNINQQISLPPNLINYIVNVLRLKEGNQIILFNGLPYQQQLGEFKATLTQVKKRQVTALIEQFIEKDIESPIKIHLLQGISRTERMDFSIQKAVELGVDKITPVCTERSILGKMNDKRLEKKQMHWQGVALSASEQCGRTRQVAVEPIISFDSLPQNNADIKFVLAPDSPKKLSDFESLQPANIKLLIGPEGGLTANEIELAHKQGYQPLRLGPRVLRTETAGITAISIFQHLWGDLN